MCQMLNAADVQLSMQQHVLHVTVALQCMQNNDNNKNKNNNNNDNANDNINAVQLMMS